MYHYTECGLDNVWLENGYTVRKTAYGEATSVIDVDGLLKALALSLTKKKGRLTGKELRFMRTCMCLSQGRLGKLVGSSENAVSLWERHGKVPKTEDAVVRMLVLEKYAGDGNMEKALELANDVDRMVNQRLVAKARAHEWKARVLAHNDERFALAA
jgi:DNA-binding transcriptional regulator YiaG